MLGIIGQYAMREVALRRWSFVSREFEHCRGLLGSSVQLAVGLIQNPQPYKTYKHLGLGGACCGLPDVSGTVQTTRHIEWIDSRQFGRTTLSLLSMRAPFAPPAILGSVAAAASLEDGTFQNVSYLPTFSTLQTPPTAGPSTGQTHAS